MVTFKKGKSCMIGKRSTIPAVADDKYKEQPPGLPPSPTITVCSSVPENDEIDNSEKLDDLRNKRSLFKKKKDKLGTHDVKDDNSVAVSVFSFAKRRSNTTRKKPVLIENTHQPRRCNSKARDLGFCEDHAYPKTEIQVVESEQQVEEEKSKRKLLERQCSVEVSLSELSDEIDNDTKEEMSLRPALRQERRYARKAPKSKKKGTKKKRHPCDDASSHRSDDRSVFSDASSKGSRKYRKAKSYETREFYDAGEEGSWDESIRSTRSRKGTRRNRKGRKQQEQDPLDACATAVLEVIFG